MFEFETNTVLNLSTAHLSPGTREMMERNNETNCLTLSTYPKNEFGWFVYITAQTNIDNLPDDLKACVTLAKHLNCNMICFDCDVEPIKGLPVTDETDKYLMPPEQPLTLTPILGYVTVYIALYFDNQTATMVKYHMDFQKCLTRNFFEYLLQTAKDYYKAMGYTVIKHQYVTEEQYNAYCKANPDENDAVISWDETHMNIKYGPKTNEKEGESS